MQINCTDKELFIFKKISAAAKELFYPTFIIGGFVRDKIIGRPSKDADIVCVGDGILLAEKVADRFHPKPCVAFFKNFGTAQIKIDTFEIEFVGARKESYRSESRNPDCVLPERWKMIKTAEILLLIRISYKFKQAKIMVNLLILLTA